MTFDKMFGKAEWIGTGNDSDIPVILDCFTAREGERAEITILGFGVFILYINGVRAHDTECLPLATDYEDSDFPAGEVLSHRVYPEVMDISHLVKEGENLIAIQLGNGWYNDSIWDRHSDGRKKAAYRLRLGEGKEAREQVSDSKRAVWLPSEVTFNHYNKGECRDSRITSAEKLTVADIRRGKTTVREQSLNRTEYLQSDCPRDRKIADITPTLLQSAGRIKLYDFGENTTGYPIVCISADEGEEVKIDFSEKMVGNDLDPNCQHEQRFNIIGNGTVHTVRPRFGWIAARYARVEGRGEIVGFEVVHADVKPSSDFECDNEVLNYLHKTYLHTQLTNMHTGLPSDCPQIERRGYTGDGQLVCRAAMLMTDSKDFYRKWLYDISDCQDRITGHVQNTAPYTHAGGGPGGWGSAIITVPYEFYLRFGDSEPMREMYPQMHKYLSYLDLHSENRLVCSDKEGEWCLGDWCCPGGVILPEPFVNNYFYVKSCERLIEIARIIGKDEDIPALEKRIEERRHSTTVAYLSPNTSCALSGVQGANAFAVDMGIGNDETKNAVIERYSSLGHYDTGIFGTDILTRVLFELGRGDIAVRLMSASEPHGFGKFKERGETTLCEYWDEKSRSHSHPMFGAVTVYLYDYVLGIRQARNSTGYKKIIISPSATDTIKWARGYVSTADGEKISVEYRRCADKLELELDIPESVDATAVYNGKSLTLDHGKQKITL